MFWKDSTGIRVGVVAVDDCSLEESVSSPSPKGEIPPEHSQSTPFRHDDDGEYRCRRPNFGSCSIPKTLR